jgi:hypothetical protein
LSSRTFQILDLSALIADFQTRIWNWFSMGYEFITVVYYYFVDMVGNVY